MAVKMMRMEQTAYEERLKRLDCFNLEKRRLRKDMREAYKTRRQW